MRLRAAIGFALFAVGVVQAQAAGDPVRGARVFERCYACHSLDPAERNLPGPTLAGLFGRRAGTLTGFEFSPAMIEAGRKGLVWSAETLEVFLRDADDLVPGTVMGGIAVPNAADRANLIAYLTRDRN